MTTKQHLRRLATLRPDGHKVLSVYLNLDPSELPTQRDRKIEIESLLDVAERALRDDGLRDELRSARVQRSMPSSSGVSSRPMTPTRRRSRA